MLTIKVAEFSSFHIAELNQHLSSRRLSDVKWDTIDRVMAKMRNVRTLKAFIAGAAISMLTACASPIMKPDMVDRLTGLVAKNEIRQGSDQIVGSKNLVVAVINSQNVEKSINITQSMMSMLTGAAQLYHLDFESGEDAKIVLSSERLMQALRAPLNQRFKSVVEARSISEAFTKGADYVAVLDLELGYEYHEDPTYKWMNFTHTANASYLFINKDYQQGPELVSLVTHNQRTPAAGASANNSDFLVNVKEARVKMLRQIYQEASIKIRN
jgi:hypothetical protein